MAESKSPLVGVAGVVGAMSVAIVAIIAIFAKEHMWVAALVVGALALMGMVMAAFARRKND